MTTSPLAPRHAEDALRGASRAGIFHRELGAMQDGAARRLMGPIWAVGRSLAMFCYNSKNIHDQQGEEISLQLVAMLLEMDALSPCCLKDDSSLTIAVLFSVKE